MRYGLLLCQLGTYDPLLPGRRSLELPRLYGQLLGRDFNPQDEQLLLRTNGDGECKFETIRPVAEAVRWPTASGGRTQRPCVAIFSGYGDEIIPNEFKTVWHLQAVASTTGVDADSIW